MFIQQAYRCYSFKNDIIDNNCLGNKCFIKKNVRTTEKKLEANCEVSRWQRAGLLIYYFGFNSRHNSCGSIPGRIFF